jgi:protein-S-isoprenylcysteine O-methyltransferase Ste14
MILFITTFSLWAGFHSATASLAFKAIIRDILGQRAFDGLYRLAYNIISFVTFIPVITIGAAMLPNKIVWRFDWPLSMAFFAIQGLGAVGLLASVLQTDLLRFAGVGQAIRYLRGDDIINPQPTLVVKGPYRRVRHPLYFFSMIILWFSPVMTVSSLVFNLSATLYFWMGSIFEERRLQRVYGDAYIQYQQKVPRLIPLKFRY